MQFCIIFLKECPLPNYKICSSHTIWIYSWGESFSHKYRTWLLLVSHHIHLLSYSCSTHSAECARRKAYNHSDWSHLKNMVVTLGELLMVPCNHIFLVCPLFLWSGKLFYLPFCPHLQHFPHLPLSWWHCFLFQWENRRNSHKLPPTCICTQILWMNCAVGSTPHWTKNFVSINLPSLSSISSSPSIVDHSHEHKICCYFSHLDKIFKKLKLSDFPFSYYPISLLFFSKTPERIAQAIPPFLQCLLSWMSWRFALCRLTQAIIQR